MDNERKAERLAEDELGRVTGGAGGGSGYGEPCDPRCPLWKDDCSSGKYLSPSDGKHCPGCNGEVRYCTLGSTYVCASCGRVEV